MASVPSPFHPECSGYPRWRVPVHLLQVIDSCAFPAKTMRPPVFVVREARQGSLEPITRARLGGPHGYFLGRPFLCVRAHMDFTLFFSSQYFARNFRVNLKNLPSGELSNPSRAKYTLPPWASMSSTRKS
jgi:hypothetical protein